MKYFFRGHRLVVLSVLSGMLFAATVSVYASTTVGTDISTGGTVVSTNSGSAFGSLAIPNNDQTFPYLDSGTGFTVAQDTADPTWDYNSFLSYLRVDTDSFATAGTFDIQLNQDITRNPTGLQANFWAKGTDGQYHDLNGSVYVTEAQANVRNVTGGVYGNIVKVFAGGAVDSVYGNYVTAINEDFDNNPGTINNLYAYYAPDFSGIATNPYYSWFDSRGVRRVKEDNTFNGVGQAIEALYNPQFTKYTPGATDYERVVLGQWNSNVAEIGTQAGGTGTLRSLRLLGTAVNIVPVATASLPTCTEGSIKPVTDSNTNTWGATIAGGGSNHVLAYCDGTNWTVMAK